MEGSTANTNSMNSASAQGPALNRRRQALLEIIVSDYIETAVPVASQQLARRYELRVSPATIRNDMAEIEEMGYISRPHTSAGGVPSDPGYRFYVDRVVQRPQLPLSFGERAREAISPDDADPSTWARSAARVLSGVVNNLTIATTIKPASAKVKQIQLVHLHDRDALLVVVMQEARLRQRVVHFDAILNQETLTEVANRLNRTMTGKGITELRALWDIGRMTDPVSETAIAETVRILSDEERNETQERYTTGLRQMLDQPEFQSSHSAQDAAKIIEDEALSKLFSEPSNLSEVRVVIGEESHEEQLRPFSVVYATYGAPDDTVGVIGALGPTRMDYAKAISSVHYLAGFLSELFKALAPQDS